MFDNNLTVFFLYNWHISRFAVIITILNLGKESIRPKLNPMSKILCPAFVQFNISVNVSSFVLLQCTQAIEKQVIPSQTFCLCRYHEE